VRVPIPPSPHRRERVWGEGAEGRRQLRVPNGLRFRPTYRETASGTNFARGHAVIVQNATAFRFVDGDLTLPRDSWYSALIESRRTGVQRCRAWGRELQSRRDGGGGMGRRVGLAVGFLLLAGLLAFGQACPTVDVWAFSLSSMKSDAHAIVVAVASIGYFSLRFGASPQNIARAVAKEIAGQVGGQCRGR